MQDSSPTKGCKYVTPQPSVFARPRSMKETPSYSMRHTRLQAHPGYACSATESSLHSLLSLTRHQQHVPLASSAATALVTPSMARRPLMISGAGPENAMISAIEVCQLNVNCLADFQTDCHIKEPGLHNGRQTFESRGSHALYISLDGNGGQLSTSGYPVPLRPRTSALIITPIDVQPHRGCIQVEAGHN
jgi:hypothetical protein